MCTMRQVAEEEASDRTASADLRAVVTRRVLQVALAHTQSVRKRERREEETRRDERERKNRVKLWPRSVNCSTELRVSLCGKSDQLLAPLEETTCLEGKSE